MCGLNEFHLIFHIVRVKNFLHQDEPLDNFPNGASALSAIHNSSVVNLNMEKVVVMRENDPSLGFRKFYLFFIACPNYSHLNSCLHSFSKSTVGAISRSRHLFVRRTRSYMKRVVKGFLCELYRI